MALVSLNSLDVKRLLHGWHLGILPAPLACRAYGSSPFHPSASLQLGSSHFTAHFNPSTSFQFHTHPLSSNSCSSLVFMCFDHHHHIRLGLVFHGPPGVVQTFPTGGKIAAPSEKKLPQGSFRSSRPFQPPLPNGSFSSAARAPRAPSPKDRVIHVRPPWTMYCRGYSNVRPTAPGLPFQAFPIEPVRVPFRPDRPFLSIGRRPSDTVPMDRQCQAARTLVHVFGAHSKHLNTSNTSPKDVHCIPKGMSSKIPRPVLQDSTNVSLATLGPPRRTSFGTVDETKEACARHD